MSALSVRDALDRPVALSGPARRIVSLVPSLTELLFALDVGERVVGRTDYCLHPAPELARLPTVGGQKDPDLAALEALVPDLVIAAKEENLRRDVDRLEAAGVAVFVTDVRTIEAALALPRQIGALCDAPATMVAALTAAMQAGVEAALGLAAARPRRRSFCAIWRDPWMGANRDTYLQAVLSCCGLDDVCADDPRRYPKVDLEALLAPGLAPELVVLPSEPYPFGAVDRAAFPASMPVCLVDGTLACWYGPRLARLPELAAALAST